MTENYEDEEFDIVDENFSDDDNHDNNNAQYYSNDNVSLSLYGKGKENCDNTNIYQKTEDIPSSFSFVLLSINEFFNFRFIKIFF